MQYIVEIAFWDISEENVSIKKFKFDSLYDAMKFAIDATDHYYGIERIDASVNWHIDAK